MAEVPVWGNGPRACPSPQQQTRLGDRGLCPCKEGALTLPSPAASSWCCRGSGMPPRAQLSAPACHGAPTLLAGLWAEGQPPAIARSQKPPAIPAMGAPACPTASAWAVLSAGGLGRGPSTSPWDQTACSPPPAAPTQRQAQPSPTPSLPLGTCRAQQAAGQRRPGRGHRCPFAPGMALLPGGLAARLA